MYGVSSVAWMTANVRRGSGSVTIHSESLSGGYSKSTKFGRPGNLLDTSTIRAATTDLPEKRSCTALLHKLPT
jgi:hypothetical protein